MADMGVGFKPPKQSDLDQWEKVRRLYQNDVIFQMRCCYGPGERPARLNQVDEFLTEKERSREKSEGERLLERFKQADK
jgi:intergrase/recombinase